MGLSSDPVSPNRDLSPRAQGESKAGGRGSIRNLQLCSGFGPQVGAAQICWRSQEDRLPASPARPLGCWISLGSPFPAFFLFQGFNPGCHMALSDFIFNAPPKKMLNEIKQSPAVFWSL